MRNLWKHVHDTRRKWIFLYLLLVLSCLSMFLVYKVDDLARQASLALLVTTRNENASAEKMLEVRRKLDALIEDLKNERAARNEVRESITILKKDNASKDEYLKAMEMLKRRERELWKSGKEMATAKPAPMGIDSSKLPENSGSPIEVLEEKLYWNSRIEVNDESADEIKPGTEATVFVELAQLLNSESSVRASKDLVKTLINAAKSGAKKHRLTVRSYLLGSGDFVEFVRKESSVQHVEVDLNLLSSDSTSRDENKYSMAAPMVSIGLPIKVKKNAESCFQLAVTLWDSDDERPLDHVVVTVPTGTGSVTCGSSLQGGFGALASLLTNDDQDNFDGVFNIFEFENSAGAVHTKIIFLSKSTYEMTGGSNGIFSWEIKSSLSAYINGSTFYAGIEKARSTIKKKKYENVAMELKQKMFPPARFESETGAADAFVEFMKIVKERKNTKFFAKFTNSEGKNVYAPLALFNSHPASSGHLTISYSLPVERKTNGQCLDSWAIAYPQQLSGQEADLVWDNSSMNLPKDKFIRLDNINALRCYFGDDAAKDCPAKMEFEGTKPEVLVLLAHHASGTIWYSEKEPTFERMQLDSEPKIFHPGSVAFLSACSVLNNSSDSDVLVNRLNEFGIDTIVASPFPVSTGYGVLLSRSLVKAAAESYSKKISQSVYGLFIRANEIMLDDDFIDETYKEMSNEFVILGKQKISTCKTTI